MRCETDTIVAPVTPSGRGAVSIIRLSGNKALAIAQQLGVGELTPRVAKHTSFLDENGEPIDLGLCLYFKAPASFTGEDVVELHGHGGVIVTDCLLQRILALGARLAEPGEFCQRAFLNDKLDLTQAEAIADLIDSGSQQAAKLAVRSLQGEFADTIEQFKQQLITLRLLIEGDIDFSDEEITFLQPDDIAARIQDLQTTLATIQQHAAQGHCLQEGLTLVIAGEPNAGKSSLLNRLSGRDSAIVTPISGTTRDILREYIQIEGVPLHIIDTAGLRANPDPIEAEGIRRAKHHIQQADHVLWIHDSQQGAAPPDISTLLATCELTNETAPTITLIHNKIDLTNTSASCTQSASNMTTIYLSAKTGEGMDLLRQHLLTLAGYQPQTQGIFLARRRHLTALAEANQALIEAQTQQGAELVAEDLRQAQLALDKITGVFHADDLLGEIFSRFCIGK